MKQFESEHYIFHYGANTKAEQDISEIAAYQESCFRYICDVLNVTPNFKIEYFLCDSPEEVGRKLGITPEEVIAREAAALSKLRNQ